MLMKLFIAIGLACFSYVLSMIGLLPVIPSVTESAVVKFECETYQTSTTLAGWRQLTWPVFLL